MGNGEEEFNRKIELIRNVSLLKGSHYFEFQPGKFKGSHWQRNSVFIFESYIYFFEPIFYKYINNFSYYSFTDVNKCEWNKVIAELVEIKQKIAETKSSDEISQLIKFQYYSNYQSFETNFEAQKKDLIKLFNEFILWVKETLKINNTISILGI